MTDHATSLKKLSVQLRPSAWQEPRAYKQSVKELREKLNIDVLNYEGAKENGSVVVEVTEADAQKLSALSIVKNVSDY